MQEMIKESERLESQRDTIREGVRAIPSFPLSGCTCACASVSCVHRFVIFRIHKDHALQLWLKMSRYFHSVFSRIKGRSKGIGTGTGIRSNDRNSKAHCRYRTTVKQDGVSGGSRQSGGGPGHGMRTRTDRTDQIVRISPW